MVKIEMKRLHKVRSKGKWYFYAWRGGPRITAEEGSREFQEQYIALTAPASKLDDSVLKTWVNKYRQSNDFTNLSSRTQAEWSRWLDRIEDHFGATSIAAFDRPLIRVAIRKWRDTWKDRPRTADYGKQVLSRVLSFAVAEGKLAANPCKGIPNLYNGDRSEIIWSADDLTHFCNAAPQHVAWAARFAALTGFRQGDCFKACWSHVGTHAIEIKTGKSGHRRTASAPLTADLRALLAEIPKRQAVILTNSRGKPWRSFNSSWNKAVAKAWPKGRDLHFHDLRGTAATNLYSAGLTTRDIADCLGWSERRVERIIDRYVRRDQILAARVRQLEGTKRAQNKNKTVKQVVKPSSKTPTKDAISS